MNRWRIPEWLEREVRQRDTDCVYCRVAVLVRCKWIAESTATWAFGLAQVTANGAA
jgi:hypothetical protein